MVVGVVEVAKFKEQETSAVEGSELKRVSRLAKIIHRIWFSEIEASWTSEILLMVASNVFVNEGMRGIGGSCTKELVGRAADKKSVVWGKRKEN